MDDHVLFVTQRLFIGYIDTVCNSYGSGNKKIVVYGYVKKLQWLVWAYYRQLGYLC